MVFYADLRVPPFSVQVNANFVRTVIEETHDCELQDELLEAVCERVETEVGYKLWVDFNSDDVGETILDCYQTEVSCREDLDKKKTTELLHDDAELTR